MPDSLPLGVHLIDRGSCPLCDSSISDTYIPFPHIPVVRCERCGFIFSGRLMPEDIMDAYYRQGFGGERHRQGQMINAKTNIWAIRKLLNHKLPQTFLDVGTGYGFLLKELRDQLGIAATGVELSGQEARYGIEKLRVKTINNSLAKSGLKSNSFDVVACFEVIEHTPSPKIFLDQLLKYLKPDGRLLIMTDNFGSQVAKKLGAGFPKWIPHSHISHFEPKTLRKLLLDKDMEIETCLSYTPWELWVRSIYYSLRRNKLKPEYAFDLAGTLNTEMQGSFRFYALRSVVSPVWAKMTANADMEGALMYVVAKRCV